MKLTPEQAEARLSSQDNLANRFGNAGKSVKHVNKPRRGERGNELPQFMRNQIAVLTRSGEKGKDVAAAFDVSASTVSECKTGKRDVDEDKIEESLAPIRDIALNRLMNSLNLIDDDKLASCDAPDLSRIAANISKVVSATFANKQVSAKAQVQLIIHAPSLKQETSYKTVEV